MTCLCGPPHLCPSGPCVTETRTESETTVDVECQCRLCGRRGVRSTAK